MDVSPGARGGQRGGVSAAQHALRAPRPPHEPRPEPHLLLQGRLLLRHQPRLHHRSAGTVRHTQHATYLHRPGAAGYGDVVVDTWAGRLLTATLGPFAIACNARTLLGVVRVIRRARRGARRGLAARGLALGDTPVLLLYPPVLLGCMYSAALPLAWLLYWHPSLPPDYDPVDPLTALYVAFQTYTTVGFGDHVPVGVLLDTTWARLVLFYLSATAGVAIFLEFVLAVFDALDLLRAKLMPHVRPR